MQGEYILAKLIIERFDCRIGDFYEVSAVSDLFRACRSDKKIVGFFRSGKSELCDGKRLRLRLRFRFRFVRAGDFRAGLR